LHIIVYDAATVGRTLARIACVTRIDVHGVQKKTLDLSSYGSRAGLNLLSKRGTVSRSPWASFYDHDLLT
jgi:hypothetical protein